MNFRKIFRVLFFLILTSSVVYAAEKKDVVLMQGKFKVFTKVESYEELQAFVKQNYPDFIIKEQKEFKANQVYELEPLIEIYLKDDSKGSRVKVPNRTVGEMLAYLNIELREDDLTVPGLDEVPTDSIVNIFRVREEIKEVTMAKEFVVVKRESTNPILKSEVTIQKGVPGEKKVTLKNKIVNGIVRGSVVLKEEIIKEAVPQIIEVPMKSKESKAEVLTRGASRKYVMNATAYEAGPLSTGKRPGDRGYGITASGTRARRGTVAVDPRVIPLGTKLYVKSLNPDIPDYGYAIAEDTGGAIKGMKIDLFMNTVSECFQFGRRQVEVYILPADTPADLFN